MGINLNKNKIKNNLQTYILLLILVFLLIYSLLNVVTFIFGKERNLYVKIDNHDANRTYYYVKYNNGKKIVNDGIDLSFIEKKQLKNNSNYMRFRQLGTRLTHRSEFIISLIIVIVSSIIFVSWIKNKVSNKSEKT